MRGDVKLGEGGSGEHKKLSPGCALSPLHTHTISLTTRLGCLERTRWPPRRRPPLVPFHWPGAEPTIRRSWCFVVVLFFYFLLRWLSLGVFFADEAVSRQKSIPNPTSCAPSSTAKLPTSRAPAQQNIEDLWMQHSKFFTPKKVGATRVFFRAVGTAFFFFSSRLVPYPRKHSALPPFDLRATGCCANIPGF